MKCRSSQLRHDGQTGVALVITLIMLSVITFLTVTFLVLTRRERGSVGTTTDQTTARFTADSALARAQTELVARMMSVTNDQNYDLAVSRTFFNFAGFDPGQPGDPYTNVNMEYRSAGGGGLSTLDRLRNLTNLLYDPRAPVYVTYQGVTESRHYLDLNRNGRFETNGFLPVISDDPALPYYDTNGVPIVLPLPGQTMSNFFVGDPEWIGVLDRPDLPHSPNNKFVARYAYVVLPAGKTLDINYLHNQAFQDPNQAPVFDSSDDRFVRNQGVGSWEINLAAFLNDLNTNAYAWGGGPGNPYVYRRANFPLSFANGGVAFQDAFAFLNYRYAYNYNSLRPARQTFANNALGLRDNNVDEYGDGPFMYGQTNIAEVNGQDSVTLPWAGSDSTNHYFTIDEFFSPAKTTFSPVSPITFADRLISISTNRSSYDRYTFYRMLNQLGTDSAGESAKMNINYRNVDTNGVVVPGLETNLISWRAIEFFTNAAERLLKSFDTNASVRRIPVFVNNRFVYTSTIHRLLQLAANIYDATTNRLDLIPTVGPVDPARPSVFRPVFDREGTDVYITNFFELETVADTASFMAQPTRDLSDTNQAAFVRPDDNIYNVPLVIGARRGFPNFNQVMGETEMLVARRLEFTRPALKTPVDHTNQLYSFSVSNWFGMGMWNSYSNAFPRSLNIQVLNSSVEVILTNETVLGPGNITNSVLITNVTGPSFITNFTVASWGGYTNSKMDKAGILAMSMRIPLRVLNILIQPVITNRYDNELGFPEQRWFLSTRFRIRAVLLDGQHIVDSMNISAASDMGDVAYRLMDNGNSCDQLSVKAADLWCTNRIISPGTMAMPTVGILNQRLVNEGQITPTDAKDWNSWAHEPVSGDDVGKSQERFFFNLYGVPKGSTGPGSSITSSPPAKLFSAPFVPFRRIYQRIHLQANDPLVHATLTDLTDLNPQELAFDADNSSKYQPLDTAADPSTFNKLNPRFDPWGGFPNKNNKGDSLAFEVALKDPGINVSDQWSFPTNKFPNVGWLGRVHRGTPWQTVYLKPVDVVTASQNGLKNWKIWTGTDDPADATNKAPILDRALFDLFTTAPNENALRGQMSINQTNLAAWSAVLSGVIVLTNNTVDGSVTTNIIQPAGHYQPLQPPPIVRIVNGINRTRFSATNGAGKELFPNQTFTKIGDILAVPELTLASPYVKTNLLNQANPGGLSDAVMERIPQQIMSLLTLSHQPRFVIYAYGQTLHPADHSIVTSASLGGSDMVGLCTNYQVTAEAAARVVVRVEGSSDPADAKKTKRAERYPPYVVIENFNVLPPE